MKGETVSLEKEGATLRRAVRREKSASSAEGPDAVYGPERKFPEKFHEKCLSWLSSLREKALSRHNLHAWKKGGEIIGGRGSIVKGRHASRD